MLNDNLAKVRKEKGLTQEALALKLNVVRQTVSKWEKGIAVPDADMLCRIAEALDVPVSVLLSDTGNSGTSDTQSIVEVLAQMNEQLAIRNRRSANVWKGLFSVSLVIIGILIGTVFTAERNSPALPEKTAVTGVDFTCYAEEVECTFVPGIENRDIAYKVTMAASNHSSKTVSAECENGVCMARFALEDLPSYLEYDVILNVSEKNEIRNMTIAEELTVRDHTCMWQIP
ncbi:MAG: helix-turn-helix domain-containing protein [Bulleidia sp.]